MLLCTVYPPEKLDTSLTPARSSQRSAIVNSLLSMDYELLFRQLLCHQSVANCPGVGVPLANVRRKLGELGASRKSRTGKARTAGPLQRWAQSARIATHGAFCSET